MFGANKRLRDLGKDTSTMYNPSAYDSRSSKKIYVVNTKNNSGNQSIGVSNGATTVIKIIIFFYIAIFVLSFALTLFDTFSDLENEFETEHIHETFVSGGFEEDWANEFYYYLTQSDYMKEIEFDDIALVDLNFDDTPELLVRSYSYGWGDFIVESAGNAKFNRITIEDNLSDLKLYKYVDNTFNWGIIKVIDNTYAHDPMIDTYWMNKTLRNNKYESELMSMFKSYFDQVYSDTYTKITFTKMVESKKDFQTAIDNYYYLNDSINELMNN